MTLTTEQIHDARHKISKYISNNRIPTEATKQDFVDAITGIDTYLDDNAAAINQSIPAGPRGILTIQEKAMILKYCIDKRMEAL